MAALASEAMLLKREYGDVPDSSYGPAAKHHLASQLNHSKLNAWLISSK